MLMLKDYLQLCWFSGFPEDLPTDRKFLFINLGVYLLLGLFIQGNISDPIEAFMQIFIEVFITLIFMGALLLRDGSTYNFERFLTAILVCESFVYVLGLPILFWYIFAKGGEFASYPIYIGMALMVWSIAIIAYLIKGLFGFDSRTGGSLSVLYFVLTYFGSFGILVLTGL
ncbi:hypothetical protein BMR09_00950 [Methylococcaceae bacterium CS3]|nr:hypothetical protein BMR09_00950 [Methylococcaceae bacterium CS3]TXL19759.1 hypothetical protein BMR06_08570 [Methylococcaceae bacterium HT5]TXL19761.1 hypothetical protein BMR06_08580 [Methylococcaceae bacterium HT5]